MRKQLIELGLPCPPQGTVPVAVPAVEDAVPSQEGLSSDVSGAADDEAVTDDDPAEAADAVKDPKPKGTREEALSREHLMTHLPKNPLCEICSKAKMQRKQTRRKASKPTPDGGAGLCPPSSVNK